MSNRQKMVAVTGRISLAQAHEAMLIDKGLRAALYGEVDDTAAWADQRASRGNAGACRQEEMACADPDTPPSIVRAPRQPRVAAHRNWRLGRVARALLAWISSPRAR